MEKQKREIIGMTRTNFDKIRSMNKTQLAKLLVALKSGSCPFHKVYCWNCVAHRICINYDVSPTIYSVKKWLNEEI